MQGEGAIDARLVAAIEEVLDQVPEELRVVVRGALWTAGVRPLGSRSARGTWRLDLEAAAVKAVACSIVTTLVLQGLGAESIPATVLSIVAPFLFEVERVEVGADDVWVHARLLEAANGETIHLSSLYERLPADIRNELSVRDFLVVVERLRSARLLVVGANGAQIRPRSRRRGFKLLLS